MQLALLEDHAADGGHHGAVRLAERLDAPTAAAEVRRIVASVRVGDESGVHVEDAEPDGHEHARVVVLVQDLVDVCEDAGRRRIVHGTRLDERLRHRHEERGADPLARHVAHAETESIRIQFEDVVEVAAHLPCGLELRVDTDGGGLREVAGEHGHLDLASGVQLLLHALLVSLDDLVGASEVRQVLLQRELCTDTGLHDGRRDGLGQVVCGPQVQPLGLVLLLAHGRDEDDRDVLGGIVLLELTADFIAVHLGHHDVQEDQVRGARGACRLERLRSVDGGHDLVVRLEQIGQHVDVEPLVVDDQDPLAFFHLGFHP